MHSIGGLFLGLINIGIVAVLLILLGLFIEWLCNAFKQPLGGDVRKFYLLLVLLICLYMLVALLFGLPSLRLIS